MWVSRWELSPEDFLSEEEVRLLRKYVFQKAMHCKGWVHTRVLEYMIVEIGLQTGLRVMELSDLQCGDVVLNGAMSFIRIRNGKGGVPGIVRIGNDLVDRLNWFIEWKKSNNEPTDPMNPLFVSSHTKRAIRKRAVQDIFKRCCLKAGIKRQVYAHMMRHTYASILYSKSGHNLRLVQTQLRHKSSRTTEVYASVLNDAYKALDDLYD